MKQFTERDLMLKYLFSSWARDEREKEFWRKEILKATGGKNIIMSIPKNLNINDYL